MKKFVSTSLDSALISASSEFGCSVAELEYEVIQSPSNGFLGFWKKEAIIIVDDGNIKKDTSNNKPQQKHYQTDSKQHTIDETYNFDEFDKQEHFKSTKSSAYDKWGESSEKYRFLQDDEIGESIWGDFSTSENESAKKSNKDDAKNVEIIKKELTELFSYLPFEIDTISVGLEGNTLSIYINGKDCALLIGEKGYRYKALSYLLFNWINPLYGYQIRLEIAEFLKNQEEMIDVYLKDIIKMVSTTGKAQTKTLDGVLVYIALDKLRKLFPNKYVSIRQTEDDEKYIIVNEFRR